MADITFEGEAGIRQFPIKAGEAIFGENGADAGDVTDHNVFIALVGGSGSNRLYITRGNEGDIVRWSLTNPHDLTAITAQGLATRDLEANDCYGKLGADIVLGYAGHLVTANTREEIKQGTPAEPTTKIEYHPYRVRWSAFADYENFRRAGDSNASYVDLIEDEESAPILNVLALREIVVAYKRNAIYNLTDGGDASLFVSERQVPHLGILAPKAVAAIKDGNSHLLISDDNFYIYDGFQVVDAQEPTGDPIKEYFYSNLDFARKDSVYVKSIPSRGEAWITFPVLGGGRRAICWNWETDSWTRHDLSMHALGVVRTISDKPIVFAGGHSTEDDKKGLVRLFDAPFGTYVRDGQNRGTSEAIRGTVDLPAIPLIIKERGEGVRQRSYFFDHVELELNANIDLNPDESDETKTPLADLVHSGDLVVAQRFTDNITIPVRVSEEDMEPMAQQIVGNEKSTFAASEDDQKRRQRQYVGLHLEFNSEDNLEELGQIVESGIVSEPYS